jgi:8-oxo-dGTP diphosphatase
MTTIVVAAAVIERGDRFLLTRRQPGVHLEGYWEFPGGKCEAGETPSACVRRELREELDVDAAIGAELLTTTHQYLDRAVEIHFLRCDFDGVPSPQQGQEMQWVRRADITTLAIPPADAELIALLLDGRPGGR